VTARNKINFFWDEQHPCNGATWTPNGNGCRKPSGNEVFESVFGSPNTSSPEAGGYSHRFQRVQQGTWSSPVTNKLLLEAGYGTYLSRWGTNRRPDSVTADVVRVTEGCSTALGCANNGGIANLNYRSEAPFDDWIGAHVWRASASYVTGANSMKFGYQGAWHQDQQKNFPNSTYTTYTLQNGVAYCSGAQVLNAANSCQGVSIAETLTPFQIDQNVRFDALYFQDQYTMGRWTFQGAVRFDHAWSYYHDETVGGVRFLPGSITFAENDPTLTTPSVANCGNIPNTSSPGVALAKANGCANQVTGFKDITPRGGVAWDVRGDGKTSVKVSIGKYLEAASSGNGVYTSGNPVSRMPTGLGISRSWNDVNRNFAPDCVLENPLANGECGNLTNQAFGTPTFTNSFDSTLMGGWGVRPNDWGFVDPAAAGCADVGRVQLHAPVARELRRDRQPGHFARRLSPIHGCVADRCTSRRGQRTDRRHFGSAALRADSGGGVVDAEQPGDAGVEPWRESVPALQRLPDERSVAASRRADAVRWLQHRQDDQRQLRSSLADSGVGGRVDDAGGAGGDGVQSVVPSGHGMGHTRDRAGLLRHPEGRCAR
jgi:hypothetical protein